MLKIKFKGMLIKDIVDYPKTLQKEGRFVYGNLIKNNNGKCWIVGEMIEDNHEYCNIEYWYPVHPDTIKMIVEE